jgi:NADPH2:quinone reductase
MLVATHTTVPVVGTEETIMAANSPDSGRRLQSLVTAEGTLELRLVDVPVPEPGPDEVVIRVEAAPINPSDLWLLLAGADLSTAQISGPADDPVLTAAIPGATMRALTGRVGAPSPVGSEGAGTVIATGSSPAARALLGRTVAVAAGAMYSQYRSVAADQCLPLPEGTSAEAGASAFVNPLTALGMVETMRREGHRALVHTAAASSLGQMLTKLCLAEAVPLVNIVRRPEQEEILRAIGAVHVIDSTSPSFTADLIQALTETSATLAFDAVGGGRLAGQILTGMEVAASAKQRGYSRYGSSTHKQVYIYGGLDPSPTQLSRNFGMAWGIGGWLLTPFLQSIGPEALQRLRDRVADGLLSTFASNYTAQVSLAGALQPDTITAYARHATGEKYLIRPAQRG